jgi:hypothetical protein
MPYYQDVDDQVLRTPEWTDGLRDLVTSILGLAVRPKIARLRPALELSAGRQSASRASSEMAADTWS